MRDFFDRRFVGDRDRKGKEEEGKGWEEGGGIEQEEGERARKSMDRERVEKRRRR